MPELPEVETIKKGLTQKILGLKIKEVKVLNQKIVRNGLENFYETLKDNKIKTIGRIGKLLIIGLEEKNFLLIHLGMTGQLVYIDQKNIIAGGHNVPQRGGLPNKWTRVILKFNNNVNLFYNDVRQFGYLKLVEAEELDKIKKRYGIEPLTKNFHWDDFKKIFWKRKTKIKNILLNQSLIAGIGNIYADEILFAAGIHPQRAANTLREEEIKNIFKATEVVLKKSIEHRGTTFSDYVDASGNQGGFVKFLKVYGRTGKKCLKCKQGIITKIKIAGRGTSFCPSCQRRLT
jgi:formamidopyrimidine-DNA glycosylase